MLNVYLLFGIIDLIIKLCYNYYVNKWDNIILRKYLKDNIQEEYSMSELFTDKIWNYKNFNMVTELDIAGEFIYDGIHTLNQMNSIEQDAMLFSFLYHVSVGIERIQKIVLVLFEEVTLSNYEEFEKSLITHSHSALNERILKNTKLQLNTRENVFLQLLSEFYKTARYQRFNVISQHRP